MSSSTIYAPVARLLNNEEEKITYNVKPEYAANIPEALNLSWEDDFFANDDDVIAVFDLDYELMRSFYEQMGWCTYFSSILIPPAFILATVPGLIPVFLKRNVAWNVNAQHVAVTRDGIRFVRDFRKSCWGLNCTDQGKNSKTVPFDKITGKKIIFYIKEARNKHASEHQFHAMIMILQCAVHLSICVLFFVFCDL